MNKYFLEKIKVIENKIMKDASLRIRDFEKYLNLKNEDDFFIELCFCIVVANNSISNALEAYNKIGKKFLTLNLNELKIALKNTSKRFYNKRAEYIFEARKIKKDLYQKILFYKKLKNKNNNLEEIVSFEKYFRDWLSSNIKGFGYKEASHFLRNIGGKNLAILDRHILKFLYKEKIIDEIPKTLTKKKYLEIENILEKIAKKLKISMTELDIYIFYIDSGRICEK